MLEKREKKEEAQVQQKKNVGEVTNSEKEGKDPSSKEDKKSNEFFKWNIKIDKDIAKLVSLFLAIIFLFLYFNSFLGFFDEKVCGDGTSYEGCSNFLPYFCLKGTLVQDSFFCGCPEGTSVKGDFCEYKYQTSPKTISLDYVLRGVSGKINFVVYKGMETYLKKNPQTSFYLNGENYSLQDFKQRVIEEKEQRKLLLPLVVELQNLAKNKEDQARIAISLVQNIPYEQDASFDEKNPLFWDLKYPYDVLYQKEGLCGSKSDLLAFLLKELGYEVIIFHYYSENHEVVGIKCPVKYSLNNTGYCFVETTKPAILSYSQGEYSEQGKLSSAPEIIYISNGTSLGRDLDEYKDARDLNRILEEKEKGMNLMEYFRYNQLVRKYDLEF